MVARKLLINWPVKMIGGREAIFLSIIWTLVFTQGYDSVNFQCMNNVAIPPSAYCDGYPDCANGEDEINCNNGQIVNMGQFGEGGGQMMNMGQVVEGGGQIMNMGHFGEDKIVNMGQFGDHGGQVVNMAQMGGAEAWPYDQWPQQYQSNPHVQTKPSFPPQAIDNNQVYSVHDNYPQFNHFPAQYYPNYGYNQYDFPSAPYSPPSDSYFLDHSSTCSSAPPTSSCPLPWARQSTRWFYDANIGECQQFQYNGCGAGANNFLTQEDCQMSQCSHGQDGGFVPQQNMPIQMDYSNAGSFQEYPSSFPHNGIPSQPSNQYSPPSHEPSGLRLFQCHDGTRLDYNIRCNGVLDCMGGEDEGGCQWYKDSSIPSINTAQFDDHIAKHNFVVVEFFALWCRACVEFHPHMEQAALELASLGVSVVKVNSDTETSLKQRFNIDTFPRLLFWSRAICDSPVEYEKELGLDKDTFVDWVKQKMKETKDDCVDEARDDGMEKENCDKACTREYQPICGSDGRTYGNICKLKIGQCKNKNLQIISNGECSQDDDCSKACTREFQPVCGSDRVTYNNRCLFEIAQCRNSGLQVRSNGECSQDDDCSKACTREFRPVCGSDQVTYNNMCLFEIAQCRNSGLQVRSNGQCSYNDDCSKACTREFRPVCGSNQVTYNNMCLFEIAQCRNHDLQAISYGECTQAQSEGKCSKACSREFRPVCGSDQVTYNNMCLFEIAQCKNNQLQVVSNGACPAEDYCSKVCTMDYRPVCGSDKVTYSNMCHFEVAQCRNSGLQVTHGGQCTEAQYDGNCERTEFTCVSDRTCISYFDVCNGNYDCADQSDEWRCREANCTRTEFRCSDLSCVDFGRRCDGSYDCRDNSDEMNCPPVCHSSDEFSCNNGACIRADQRCDGNYDCDDRTDELGCPAPVSDICDTNTEFMCADRRRCIKKEMQCDGFPDCGDISDEQGCPDAGCSSEWLFRCSDGDGCIDKRRLCDGYNDCQDFSDETDCLLIECQYWQMKCVSDGVCVHEGVVCNGEKDCADGTDELNCPSWPNSQSNATIGGGGQRCQQDCGVTQDHVCGSNGITYQNQCLLELEACERNVGIQVAYVGDCQPEVDLVKDSDCPDLCPNTWEPVCGDNNVTYSNKCQMEAAQCQLYIRITQKYQGSCSECHPSLQWRCEDGGGCVNMTAQCDGKTDCADGSDETYCTFTCNDGAEIPISKNCDGFPDCDQGEDENYCQMNGGNDLKPEVAEVEGEDQGLREGSGENVLDNNVGNDEIEYVTESEFYDEGNEDAEDEGGWDFWGTSEDEEESSDDDDGGWGW